VVDSVDVVGDVAEHGLIGVCVADGVGGAGVAVAWLADTAGVDDESVVDGCGMLDVGVAKDESGVVVEIRAEVWEFEWIDVFVAVLGMGINKEVLAVSNRRCLGEGLKPFALCIREGLLGVFEAGVRHLVESVHARLEIFSCGITWCLISSGWCRDTSHPTHGVIGNRDAGASP
jgi:hypothetical protein